jgi:hypothetical protein
MRYATVPALLLLLLLSCGGNEPTAEVEASPEARAFAMKVCTARNNCGCTDGRFASYKECRDEIAESFDAQVAAGATIDKSCLDEALAKESLNGCPTWVWEPEMWACPALVSAKTEGEACALPSDLNPLIIDACGGGLFCVKGVCTPETGPPPVKTYAVGDPCTPTEGCGGMYCSYDHHCRERVALGGDCDHPSGCEVGIFCEGLGRGDQPICAEQKQPGEACDPYDWGPCDSPNFPDEVNACDPNTNLCTPDQPGICRLTHTFVAKQ